MRGKEIVKVDFMFVTTIHFQRFRVNMLHEWECYV
jgi:hypothetical protein